MPPTLAAGQETRDRAGQRVLNLQVLTKANRPPANISLRIARLKCLPRLILCAPTVLLRPVGANRKTEGSWYKVITDDFEWLYEHLDEKRRPTAAVDLV